MCHPELAPDRHAWSGTAGTAVMLRWSLHRGETGPFSAGILPALDAVYPPLLSSAADAAYRVHR